MLFEYFVIKLLKRNAYLLESKFENRIDIATGSNSFRRKLEPDIFSITMVMVLYLMLSIKVLILFTVLVEKTYFNFTLTLVNMVITQILRHVVLFINIRIQMEKIWI